MKAIVRAQTDVANYAMYFAWPSLMSHGSILALHEVSRAIAGSGANFPAAAVTDGTGNANLLQAVVAVHSLTFKLCKVFGIGQLAQELANLIQRADAVRSRLFPNIPKRNSWGWSPLMTHPTTRKSVCGGPVTCWPSFP